MREQFELIYTDLFKDNKLSALEINMIADEYLEYEEGKVWLTEGGVELKFEDERIASFTYEEDDETGEIKFLCVESELLPFISKYDYYPIDLKENKEYYSFIDEKINHVDIHWARIDTLDYNGAVQHSEDYPLGFIFHFENGCTLQIASIAAKIKLDTQEFDYIKYSLEGQILVSFNRIFEII